MELRKLEEKDQVMVNLYAIFQIGEAVTCSQMFFKIGVLKSFVSFTASFTQQILIMFHAVGTENRI